MDASAPESVRELPVEFLFEFQVEFDAGMAIYATPFGTRIDAIVSGGKAVGPRFNGELLAGGGDWLIMPADGIARMDVRATVLADGGDYVHYTSSGRVVLDEAARDRFLSGQMITTPEMYGRAAPLFETAAENYRWMNGVVSTGVIVELSLEHIRYQIFAIQ